MPEIAPARAADLDEIKRLFREYSALVSEALCFQGFDQELAGLPGAYVPPSGALLIARDGDAVAGCVALRRLDERSAEMKRMYVREAWRGTGLGRRLALAIIEEAKRRGYARVVLDTLPKLSAAIALYRDLGFRETGPYLASPTPGALCFELSFS
ncbi:MAG TPA: GNAT family N-acetyltransferase [Burkholderiales bacterium]|nr:GNAT family N-acetyltransferase [Burkholderiales bacterium]